MVVVAVLGFLRGHLLRDRLFELNPVSKNDFQCKLISFSELNIAVQSAENKPRVM